MSKAIQVNGIIVNREICFYTVYQSYVRSFKFVPYNEFISSNLRFINPEAIRECDTVVVFDSLANNSQEVYYIKLFISVLFFSNRIVSEKPPEYLRRRELVDNSFASVWNLNGYWDKDGNIIDNSWYVKLGINGVSPDDFESYVTRAYGYDLDDSFEKRYVFIPNSACVDVNADLIRITSKLNALMCSGDDMGRRMISVARLYYEVLSPHCSMNVSIIVLATILETILLRKDENNQRKKVSVRTACLVYDGYPAEWKSYLADMVYYFYKFRNGIVHDGMNYLDYPEITTNSLIYNIKHFVFYLIKMIYQGTIKSQEDIDNIVRRNTERDNMDNAFKYISDDAGERFKITPPE